MNDELWAISDELRNVECAGLDAATGTDPAVPDYKHPGLRSPAWILYVIAVARVASST